MSKSGSDYNTSGQASNLSKSTQSADQRKSAAPATASTVPGGYANSVKGNATKAPVAPQPTTAVKPPSGNVPVRTSSAPPEEHSKPENKSHFIPTKTGSLHTGNESGTLNYRSAVVKNEASAAEAKTTETAPTTAPEVAGPVESPPVAPSASSAPEGSSSAPVASAPTSEEPKLASGLSDNANSTNEYRPQGNRDGVHENNRDNRRNNNPNRNRSGSGNFNGSYNQGGRRNNAPNQPPQMTTPGGMNVTAGYAYSYPTQTAYYPQQQQQQYVQQQQQQQYNMTPEQYNVYTTYYQQYYAMLFSQFIQSGYDQNSAAYYSQIQASQYAMGHIGQISAVVQQQAVITGNPQQQQMISQQQAMQQQQVQQQHLQQQQIIHQQQQQQMTQHMQQQHVQQPYQQQQQYQQQVQQPGTHQSPAQVQVSHPQAVATQPVATAQQTQPVPQQQPQTTAPQQQPVSQPQSAPVAAATAPVAATAAPVVAAEVAQPVAPVVTATAPTTAVPSASVTAPTSADATAVSSAAATPTVPDIKIKPPEAKKLSLKKKINGVLVEVDPVTMLPIAGTEVPIPASSAATPVPPAAPAAAAETKKEPVVAEPSAKTGGAPGLAEPPLSVQTNSPLEVDGPASWEDREPSLPSRKAPPALTTNNRVPVASSSSSSSSKPAGSRVYSRQDILDLRPQEFERVSLYITGLSVASEGNAGGYGGRDRGDRGGYGGKQGGGARDRGDREGGRGGGEYRERGEFRGGDRRDRGDRNNNKDAPTGDDWGKEKLPSPAKASKPVIPFKKDRDDPLENLSQEMTEILNKITPQTFEKLSRQILELKLENTAMLDRLVKLIFEKAVYETGFSGVYAELCAFLKENATAWTFYTLVRDIEKDEYFWVKDFAFPEEYAGQYFSRTEAIEAVRDGAPMKAMPSISIDSKEVLLVQNHLVQIGKTLSDHYYVTYVPLDQTDADSRSQNVFPDENSAKKDAQTNVAFRARLAYNCEREFTAAVKDENLYDAVDEELRQLRSRRTTMSIEDFERQEADIEEKRIKIKRRMQGNIKFVGELYKCKLLNTETMHDCITKLLGPPDNWKQVQDEQDLELLCNLLTTLGESLENKSNKSKNKQLAVQFNSYFERLTELRADMTLPSRIRFGIEDVIALRNRSWQGRKVAEGPMKISELHQKMQEEQKAQAAAAAKPTGGRGGPQGGNGGAKSVMSRTGSSNDARNMGGNNNKSGPGGKGAAPTSKNAGASVKKLSPVGGGGNNNRGAPKETPSAPVAAAPVVYEFVDDKKSRKATETLKEYLANVSVDEVVATLREEPPAFPGYLILQLIDQLLNLSDANKRKRLLDLLSQAALVSELRRGREAIKQAIESCESFRALVDTILDCLEAPENFGALLVVLISQDVLDRAWVQQLVAKNQADNVETMDHNSPEDIEAAFARLRKVLDA